MEPFELLGWTAAVGYITHVYFAGVVADEKGFSSTMAIFLAFITGPLVWLYLIARPVTWQRLAEREVYVGRLVLEIREILESEPGI